ncbi:hypothetical protein H4219_005580, partial [Mycoemilia scoparia]
MCVDIVSVEHIINQQAQSKQEQQGQHDSSPTKIPALFGQLCVVFKDEETSAPPFFVTAGSILFSDYSRQSKGHKIQCHFGRYEKEWASDDLFVLIYSWRYIPPPVKIGGQKSMAYAYIEVLESPILIDKRFIGNSNDDYLNLSKPLDWWRSQALKDGVFTDHVLEGLRESLESYPPQPPVVIKHLKKRLLTKKRTKRQAPVGIIGNVVAKSPIFDSMYFVEVIGFDESSQQTEQSTQLDTGSMDQNGQTVLLLAGDEALSVYPALNVGDDVYVTHLSLKALNIRLTDTSDISIAPDKQLVFCSSLNDTKIYLSNHLDMVDVNFATKYPIFTNTLASCRKSTIPPRYTNKSLKLSDRQHPQQHQQQKQEQTNENLTSENIDPNISTSDHRLISYIGEVTKTIDEWIGIYELDNTHLLFLSNYPSYLPHNNPLRPGARIAIDNVHIIVLKNTDAYKWEWIKVWQDCQDVKDDYQHKQRRAAGLDTAATQTDNSTQSFDFGTQSFAFDLMNQSMNTQVCGFQSQPVSKSDKPELKTLSIFAACPKSSIRVVEFPLSSFPREFKSPIGSCLIMASKRYKSLVNIDEYIWRKMSVLELIETVEICWQLVAKFQRFANLDDSPDPDNIDNGSQTDQVSVKFNKLLMAMDWSLGWVGYNKLCNSDADSSKTHHTSFPFLDHDSNCNVTDKRPSFETRIAPIIWIRQNLIDRLQYHLTTNQQHAITENSPSVLSTLPLMDNKGMSLRELGLANVALLGRLCFGIDGRWYLADDSGALPVSIIKQPQYIQKSCGNRNHCNNLISLMDANIQPRLPSFDRFQIGDVIGFTVYAGICESIVFDMSSESPSKPLDPIDDDEIDESPVVARAQDMYVLCEDNDQRSFACPDIFGNAGNIIGYANSYQKEGYVFIYTSLSPTKSDVDENSYMLATRITYYGHLFQIKSITSNNGRNVGDGGSENKSIDDLVLKIKSSYSRPLDHDDDSIFKIKLDTPKKCLMTVKHSSSQIYLKQYRLYFVALGTDNRSLKEKPVLVNGVSARASNNSNDPIAIEVSDVDFVSEVSLDHIAHEAYSPLPLVNLDHDSLETLITTISKNEAPDPLLTTSRSAKQFVPPTLKQVLNSLVKITQNSGSSKARIISFIGMIKDNSIVSCSLDPLTRSTISMGLELQNHNPNSSNFSILQTTRSITIQVSDMCSSYSGHIGAEKITGYIDTQSTDPNSIYPGALLPGMIVEFHNVKLTTSENSGKTYFVTTGESVLRPLESSSINISLTKSKMCSGHSSLAISLLVPRILEHLYDHSIEGKDKPNDNTSTDPMNLEYNSHAGMKAISLADLLLNNIHTYTSSSQSLNNSQISTETPSNLKKESLIRVQIESIDKWSLKFYCQVCHTVISSNTCHCSSYITPPYSQAIPETQMRCRISDGTATAKLRIDNLRDIQSLLPSLNYKELKDIYKKVVQLPNGCIDEPISLYSSMTNRDFYNRDKYQHKQYQRGSNGGVTGSSEGNKQLVELQNILEKYLPSGFGSVDKWITKRFNVIAIEDRNRGGSDGGQPGIQDSTVR